MKTKQKKYFRFLSFPFSPKSALGCIEPTPPLRGRLVYKTNNTMKYLCDINHIFPDTLLNERELFCTTRNTWNNSLPNCIGMCSTQ